MEEVTHLLVNAFTQNHHYFFSLQFPPTGNESCKWGLRHGSVMVLCLRLQHPKLFLIIRCYSNHILWRHWDFTTAVPWYTLKTEGNKVMLWWPWSNTVSGRERQYFAGSALQFVVNTQRSHQWCDTTMIKIGSSSTIKCSILVGANKQATVNHYTKPDKSFPSAGRPYFLSCCNL